MLNITIDGRFLSQTTSGVQRVAAEFVNALDDLMTRGEVAVEARVICPPNSKLDRLRLKNIGLHVPNTVLRGHLWQQTVLPFYTRGSVLLCLCNVAPVVSLLTGAPVAVMVHDLSYRIYPQAYRFAYRAGHTILSPLMLKRAQQVFTVSQSEMKMLERFSHAPAGKIIVAQNGAWAGSRDGRKGAGADEGDAYVLYVGSISKRKNIEGAIGAAVRLAREFGTRTKVVGASAGAFVYSRPEVPQDVAHQIEFLGQIEDKQALAELYKGARALVFPSFYEASPLPPVEAMAFGCPVVASDIPANRERCGDAAEYCNPSSVDSIYEAIRRVLSDPGRAAELAAAGHIVEQKYSWEAQVRRVISKIEAEVQA